ncbi:MAG TPA: PAS domain-containing protein [Dissulfurispiraceae bacterium]|nr:PAS domain-containing protein [Dissulfurispiraceae bacterium]
MSDEERTPDEVSYEMAYLRVLLSDIEQKNRQTEALLNVVTQQYRRITEVVSDYIFSVHIVDGNPVETVHGRGCLPITGYSPEEFSLNNFLWINMVYEEDRPAVLKHVAGILSGKDTAPYEHRIVRKDGAIRWVRNTPVCQYDAEGKLLAYDGLIRDVTERKQVEEALKKSEEKYRIIADFTYDWEEWIGPDGHYIYVSPSCERITGYKPQEFLANPDLVTMITHPADQARVAAHYNDSAESGNEAEHIDFRIITRNGEERWISHSCQAVYSNDGKWLGRRASNNDISTRHKLAEELMKVREMEAVGIVTAGIAHDFDELITAILGNIAVAKTHIDPESKVHHLLTNAEEVSLRVQDLTKQMIAFSRRGTPVKTTILAGNIIIKVVPAVVEDSSIICDISMPEELWPVQADEVQFTQALRSLAFNAREAMGDTGRLTVSARNVTIRDRDRLAVESGDYVRISIKDSAVDIPTENTTRIFDPELAMKDAGPQKKTGLGIAMAYSIIADHDGFITVESEIGSGTTYHVYLPAEKRL